MEEVKKQLVSFSEVADLRREVSRLKEAGKRVGLVPTMGFLHEGHLSLIDRAHQHCDSVIVSIFVNPTQFNEASDLEKYPRDLERDLELLQSRAVHAAFCPAASEIYGESFQSTISLSDLTGRLEGEHRPGHFAGVTTVVGILFNIVHADIAVFGEKDFQQLRVIEQMVSDLHIPIEIVRAPLVREPDGLAMSSRNVLLSGEDRSVALSLSRGLSAAAQAFQAGERATQSLLQIVRSQLSPEVFCEYVEVIRESDLTPEVEVADPGCRIVLAATVGSVRLIDNIALVE